MAKRAVPVKKNETIQLTMEDLTHEGNAVGKVDGYPIFTPFVLPGETAEIKVVKVNKKFAFGKLLNIQKESPERVEPPCNVFYKCGGCQLQHMSKAMQLDMKRHQVKNVMQKIAHLPDVPVHPVIGMEDPWRYRNKIQIPVGEKDGKLFTGFYRQRSHQMIEDMDTCVIQDELGDNIVAAVREIGTALGIRAYDEEQHTGELRHILVRTAYTTNKAMLVLVTWTDKLTKQHELIKRITERFPEILASIIHNVNSQKTNIILGKKSRTIYGEDYIYDKIGDLTFGISAHSFYQVNPVQTQILYEKALEYANVGKEDIVIDAYCGIGTISLFLAQRAKKVYGVEVVPQAVDDAKANARRNHMDNAEFVIGEAEKVMPWWTKQGLRPDVIVVDPPRKGCDVSLLEAMAAMNPKRIVYVSCNPSTLARDLRILEDSGYRTQEIQPVDMFAQTSHVESVAWMSR